MKQEPTEYEVWLTTIANTRLIYNTMEELEDMFDNHSIHNNGIRRCFSTPQKLRAAYRDLKVEVELMTDGLLNLDRILCCYQRAWNFYRENLYRRANPEQVALDILSFCYSPYSREELGTRKSAICQQILEQEINVPFLILMLMKAVPGYDSKDGDIDDMPVRYERVLKLMETFTANGTIFGTLPALLSARDERCKTRLMLLYHVSQILDTYESYAEQKNFYDTANVLKGSRVNLNITGFWNECEGKLLYTDFWQIEEALDFGTYFLTHWRKDAENRLTGIRYSLFVNEGADGKLICYVIHPMAIQRRMRGEAYSDADHVWYKTEGLDEIPCSIPLDRVLHSDIWPQKIHLSRCEDEEVVAQYDRWLHHDCEIVKPYQHLEYEFHPNLYAITRTHLYIPSENEGEFYKVPVAAYEGFERIQSTDNVGTMLMDGKIYLVFDELMLYIGTSKKELQKYQIERVNRIE